MLPDDLVVPLAVGPGVVESGAVSASRHLLRAHGMLVPLLFIHSFDFQYQLDRVRCIVIDLDGVIGLIVTIGPIVLGGKWNAEYPRVGYPTSDMH